MSSYKPGHNINERYRTTDVLTTENVDFAGLLLSEAVQKGLTTAGFEKPSPIQLKAIPLGRCGLDLIVQAKSGTGKTCVFSVISLESLQLDSNSTQVLVLAPTREIAVQIHDVIQSIGSALTRLRCHVFIGGLPLAQDKQKLNKCHIAVGTPGRIKQLIEENLINTNTIRLFVLDEADKLLDDSFKEQINWIYSALPENKQMLALSATYPEYLAKQLTSYMRDPVFVRLNPKDLALQGLVQYYKVVSYNTLPHKQFEIKVQHLLQLLGQVTFNQCLIFSNYQTRAQNLSDYLCVKGWPSTYISGSQDQSHRLQAMSMLKNFQCRVLISTDLTARGIDAERVNLVINLDVPYDAKTYLHRIGRAGRFGTQGIAVTYAASGQEYQQLLTIQQDCQISMKKLPDIITNDLMNQDNGDDISDSPVESNDCVQNGFHGFTSQTTSLSERDVDKTQTWRQINGGENAGRNNKDIDIKDSVLDGRKKTNVEPKESEHNVNILPSKEERSVVRKQAKQVAIDSRGSGDPIRPKARTVEKSCQTASQIEHNSLHIGVIPSLGDSMENQDLKLEITYQNAVDDFEDYLQTKSIDVDTWKKFYKKDNLDNNANDEESSTAVSNVEPGIQVCKDEEDGLDGMKMNNLCAIGKDGVKISDMTGSPFANEPGSSDLGGLEECYANVNGYDSIVSESITKMSHLSLDNKEPHHAATSSTFPLEAPAYNFTTPDSEIGVSVGEGITPDTNELGLSKEISRDKLKSELSRKEAVNSHTNEFVNEDVSSFEVQTELSVNEAMYTNTLQNTIACTSHNQTCMVESMIPDDTANGINGISDETIDTDSSIMEANYRMKQMEQGVLDSYNEEERVGDQDVAGRDNVSRCDGEDGKNDDDDYEDEDDNDDDNDDSDDDDDEEEEEEEDKEIEAEEENHTSFSYDDAYATPYQYYHPQHFASQGAYNTNTCNSNYPQHETSYHNYYANNYSGTDPPQSFRYGRPSHPGPHYYGPEGTDYYSQWRRQNQGNYPDVSDPSWDMYNAYMYRKWLNEYYRQSYQYYPPPPPYW